MGVFFVLSMHRERCVPLVPTSLMGSGSYWGSPASASERARAGVTRAIRQAITRIADHHLQLGEHLGGTIRTETYCAYMPDPRTPTGWEF